MKNNGKKGAGGKIFSAIALILAILVLVYSGWQLYSIYGEYHEGTKDYDSLETYIKENTQADPDPEQTGEAAQNIGVGTKPPETPPITVDHKALLEINKDYVGWLYVNETISYPIVKGKDNDYYLTNTFTGKQNKAGAIFFDARISQGWQAKNVILYGHNLKNSKMFGTLMNYEEADFYNQNKNIWVLTMSENFKYEVISAYTTDPVSQTYNYSFSNDQQFAAYQKFVAEQSVINTEAGADPIEHILTLSTCTNVDDGRFVVHAKRIEAE